MNLSKSAFGMITLEAKRFFTSFNCPNPSNHRDVIVRCKMQIRVHPNLLNEFSDGKVTFINFQGAEHRNERE